MKKILAALAALISALTLVLFAPAPAQAYGWSETRCDDQSSANASKVCARVHWINSGNGIKVDQVNLCAYKVSQTWYNGFRGTKGNVIIYTGSAGNEIGWSPLPDTGASAGGTCIYYNSAMQMGSGACYKVTGVLDLAQWSDGHYTIRGKVTGGSC